MRILLVLLAFSVGLFAQGNYVIPQLLGSGQTAVQPSINPGVQGSCPNWQMSTPVIATDAAHGNRLIATQPSSESKRIVIFGSSSARGVGASVCITTSWAIAFRDAMKARGYEVINVSKEGDNSTALLNRFFTDVAPLQPDFVILAGSIYNDGGPTAGNVNFHEQSIHRLIKMVESVGAIPVIMGQFPNNGYTVAQYQMVEDLYMQWEKLGVQVWDFMSSLIDPSTGHYISQISSADGIHPDDTGHALMFQSIPLGYFDVARTQRATNFSQGNQTWQWGSDTTNIPLKVTPFPSMASFTAIAWIKDATGMGSALLSSDRDSTNPLRIRSNSSTGVCELVDGGTTIAASTVSCSSGAWHHHAVSFNSATNKAAYYIDGVLIGSATLTRSGFNTSNVTFLSRFDSAGGNCVGCQLAEPMVYRVSLQAQDVVNIYNGHPLRKSLEYYSTLGSTPGGAYAPNLADTGTQGTLGSATQWSVIGTFSASTVQSSRSQNAASVMDFGAKGDGSTDDRLAIQAGLNAMASTCGTLVFPAGHTFLISSNPTNTTLLTYFPCVSMGGTGTIKLASGLGVFQSVFKCAVAIQPATIRDITIDMNGAGNPITSAPGTTNYQMTFWFISGTPGSGLTLDSLTFLNGHGVWTITTYADNVTVTRCRWDNWGIGNTVFFDSSNLYLAGNGSVVTNNTFVGTGQQAKTAIEIHASNKVIANNVIRNFYAGVIFSADQANTGTAVNISITGNTIANAMDGIQFWSTDGFVQDLAITGNSITVDRNAAVWSTGLGGVEAGISWYASSTFGITNLTIANNTIHWNAETGAYATNSFNAGIAISSSSGATLGGATINGNVIDNTPASGITFSLGGAASGISIFGNTIRNPGQRTSLAADFRSGIFLGSTPSWSGSSITGNTILDSQATPTMQRGIEWAGVASDNAGTQVTLKANHVRFTGTPTKYYQIQTSAPIFDIDVPGYAATSTLAGFSSLTAGNNIPHFASITDSLTGRVWRNLNTYTSAGTYWSSMEVNDVIPASGSYNQGDIVWSADSAVSGFAGWVNVSTGAPGTFAKIPLTNAGSNSPFTSNVNGPAFVVTGGSTTVLRCTTAGTLPIGALTTVSGNCGASTAVGLTVQ